MQHPKNPYRIRTHYTIIALYLLHISHLNADLLSQKLKPKSKYVLHHLAIQDNQNPLGAQ